MAALPSLTDLGTRARLAAFVLVLCILEKPCSARSLQLGTQSLRGAAQLNNASEDHWGSGSRRLSLTTRPPPGSRTWEIEAEERLWARARYHVRRGQLAPPENYSQALNSVANGLDPENFPPPDQSGFWTTMCDSIEKEETVVDANSVSVTCSVTDGSSASSDYPCRCGSAGAVCTASQQLCFASTGLCKAISPLDKYRVLTKTSCPAGDRLDTPVIRTELEAYLACDGDCSAIVDVGCLRTSFQLCKLGAVQEEDASSCLRLRVPDHAPPESEPRPPLEQEFWKAFCAQTQAHNFRLLFKGRTCGGSPLDLGDSWTPDRCSELSALNPECGEVFDFTKGRPNVCRCVRKGQECAAAPPTGRLDQVKNVFLRTR